jgi:hypothetical protein
VNGPARLDGVGAARTTYGAQALAELRQSSTCGGKGTLRAGGLNNERVARLRAWRRARRRARVGRAARRELEIEKSERDRGRAWGVRVKVA